MKRLICTNALYKYFLTLAACSTSVAHAADSVAPAEIPHVGLSVTDENHGDINSSIFAKTEGVSGAATTKHLYIGDINADIHVGSVTDWGDHYGVRIDYGLTPYGVHLQNLAANAHINVNSYTYATGIALGKHSTMDHILGNITAYGETKSARGILAMADVHIESVQGTIDIDSVSGTASGVILQSDVTIDSMSSTMNVNSFSGNVMGLSLNFDVDIHDFTSTINAHSVSGNATGISIQGVSTIGMQSGNGMAGTLNISSKTGVATGLYITDTSFNFMTGDVTVSSEKEAVGIQLANDGKLGTIAESTDIIVTLESNATESSAGTNSGNAYGIKAMDEIGDPGYEIRNIAGDITVTNLTESSDPTLGNAYGIHLTGDGNASTLGRNHIHESTSIVSATAVDANKAYGVYSETSKKIYFESGAQLKASSLDGKTHGYAIYNDHFGITLAEDPSEATGNAYLSGNLYAGDKALVFESGDYQVSSDTWTSSGLHLGGIDEGVTSTAKVTVTDIMSSNTQSLDIYVNSVSDYSQLLMEAGATLDLSALTEINLHFTDEFIEAWGTSHLDKIYFAGGSMGGSLDTSIDGSLTGLDLDNITINTLGVELENTIYTVNGNEISMELIPDSAPQIPEPGTATLSLLALAGLMARRRRA